MRMVRRVLVAVLLSTVCLPAARADEAPSPRVAMDALLDVRFFPEQGRYMIATSIPVLFPPPGESKARLIIKKGGEAVVTKEMIVEPWPPHNAFGNLRAADGQMGYGTIGEGDYEVSVEMGGRVVSAYRFSAKKEKGADPFDPRTELLRSGPWNKPAFLMGPTGPVDMPVQIGLWLNARELPGYVRGKPVPFTLHVLKGGTQVGLVEGAVTDGDWTFFKPELRTGHGGGPVFWSKLVGAPGAYTLEYRAGGKTLRTWKFKVEGGQIARIPQNQIAYDKPDALPAQSIIGDTRIQEYWLAPIE